MNIIKFPFHVLFTTSKECLVILISHVNNNETFCGCVNHNELKQIIYRNDINDVDINLNEILIKIKLYLQNKENQISFTYNNNDNVIILHLPYFINSNEINFTLYKTNIITNTPIFQSNNHNISNVSTINVKHKMYNENELVSFSYITNIISIILLLLLMNIIFQYIKLNHFFTLSNIINKNDFNLISNWIDKDSSFNYTLLYRATRDNCTSSAFHNLCDSKSPTITLVNTKDGWKFGGYSELKWKSGDGSPYQFHKNVFIFSISLKKKYPPVHGGAAILWNVDRGPTFGYSYDVSISDNCFKKESVCNSPVSFENMKDRNEFNGGKNTFIVKEVEVYLVEKVGRK